MQMSPVIAIHLAAASSALALGPVVLWARRSRTQRPHLHRALGYAWVTLIVMAALSALFIRDFRLPSQRRRREGTGRDAGRSSVAGSGRGDDIGEEDLRVAVRSEAPNRSAQPPRTVKPR